MATPRSIESRVVRIRFRNLSMRLTARVGSLLYDLGEALAYRHPTTQYASRLSYRCVIRVSNQLVIGLLSNLQHRRLFSVQSICVDRRSRQQ
jgi:hypothetical protein